MSEFRRVYASINLDAIYDNLSNVRKAVKPGTKVLGVIKADAYGHGAVQVGRYVEEIVDYFAVAIIEEGIELRNAGIKKPIMILGYTDSSEYEDLLRYDIEPAIYSYEQAEALSETAVKAGKDADIHLKIDTGMGRIGFQPVMEDIDKCERIAKMSGINVKGMFTHLSQADMDGEDNKAYTVAQVKKYDFVADELKKRGIDIPIKHVSNSAGIMEYSEYNKDMVRSGIVTYGLYPSDEVDYSHLKLTPAMELKSVIVHLKEVKEGTMIGYGGTYKADGNRIIATIPVGYADGYARSLSNKGSVLIRGKRAPIVGRVCMDQFMVDVTDIEGVTLKDEVTLFGHDGEEFLSVEEVSGLAGSFNYEFCCDISKRVPRVYTGSRL